MIATAQEKLSCSFFDIPLKLGVVFQRQVQNQFVSEFASSELINIGSANKAIAKLRAV